MLEIKEKLSGDKNYTYLLEDGMTVSRATWSSRSSGIVYLDHIDTIRGKERKGYASKLLNHIQSRSKGVIAQIRRLDDKTKNFYRKNGFSIKGRVAYWYKNV